MSRPWGLKGRRIAGSVPALFVFLAAAILAPLPVEAQPSVASGDQSPSQLSQAPAQAAPAARVRRGDLVLKGDAVCTRCHDEAEEYPVLSIAKTKHGTKADIRTPTCTSCHGESLTHVDKPTSAAVRPPPDRSFGKKSATPSEVRNGTCLTCHEGTNRMFWHETKHASQDTTCTSCHQVHTGHDKVRDKKEQAQVCFNCHKEKRMEVSKSSRHPVLEGQVTCSDCHNPHGSTGPSEVKRGTINDTCFQCHAEKRGPFIWNHQPVTENCAHCHNPHGTNVAGMLKWRAPFLCQQCHEPTSHRGGVPQMTMSTSSGVSALGRSCANCHTNIHGGNNPTDGSDARSLRR